MNVEQEPRSARRSRRSLAVLSLGLVAVVVVSVILALALVPVSVSGVEPTPDPASSYAEAAARFDEVLAAERGKGVYAPCRSRLLDHGGATDVAVVLVHGLTNCPRQFLDLGERIHALGANVLILRVPRHGLADDTGARIGGVGNVGGLTPDELSAYADRAVDLASGLGEDVRVLGLSMGGVVAAWAAQNRSEVDRAVTVAPALSLPHVPGFVDSAFRNLFSRLPNVSLPGSATLDHAYAGESTGALASMYRLAASVREQAATAAPAAGSIVVVTNANDDQVDNSDIRDLADAWRDNGADLTEYEFSKSLELPHDLVDVQQQGARPEIVDPVLLGLLGFGG
jgi:esterase/lipase